MPVKDAFHTSPFKRFKRQFSNYSFLLYCTHLFVCFELPYEWRLETSSRDHVQHSPLKPPTLRGLSFRHSPPFSDVFNCHLIKTDQDSNRTLQGSQMGTQMMGKERSLIAISRYHKTPPSDFIFMLNLFQHISQPISKNEGHEKNISTH